MENITINVLLYTSFVGQQDFGTHTGMLVWKFFLVRLCEGL